MLICWDRVMAGPVDLDAGSQGMIPVAPVITAPALCAVTDG